MAGKRYWFARRYPLGSPRNSMTPISPEGYKVVWTFIGAMFGGALIAVLLLVLSVWAPWLQVLAPLAFIAATVWGSWRLISLAQSRGDTQHTIDDYKAGRVKLEIDE